MRSVSWNMGRWLRCLLLVVAAGTAAAESWQETSARFWRALEARDLERLHELSSGSLFGPDLRAIVAFVSTYDDVETCHAVTRSVHRTNDGVIAEFDVTGDGHLRGIGDAPLPASWTITFARRGSSWRVQSATLFEDVVAREIVRGDMTHATTNVSRPLLICLVLKLLNLGDPHAMQVLQALDGLSPSTAERVAIDVRRAGVCHRNGDPAGAMHWGCRARIAAEETGDPDLVARAMAQQAGDAIHYARFADARALAAQAHAVADAGGDVTTRVLVLLTESAVAREGHRHLDSVELNEQASTLARRIGWYEYTAIADFNLAVSYFAMGHDVLGKRYAETAYRSLLAVGNRYVAGGAQGLIAAAELRNGELKDALIAARRACRATEGLAGTNRGDALFSLSRVLTAMHRDEEADAALQEAIKIERASGAPIEVSGVLLQQAWLDLDAGRLDEALEHADESERVVDEPSFRVSAKSVKGAALARRGDRAAAHRTLDEAVAMAESLRAEYVGDLSDRSMIEEPYNALIDLYLQEGNLEAALRCSERKRARTFLDAIIAHGGVAPLPLRNDEAEREHALRGEVDRLLRAFISSAPSQRTAASARLASARTDYEEFAQRLYLRHPDAALPFATADKVTFDLERMVSNDFAIVEYAIVHGRVLAFVVFRGARGDVRIEVRTLKIDPYRMPAIIDHYVDSIAHRNLDYRTASRRLFAQLIAPVEPLIRRARTVCIVPAGSLWRLPFQTLVDDRGRFFGSEHAIDLAPSIAALQSLQERRGRNRPALSLAAFGNPQLPVPGAALPDAAHEVREIARLYGRAKTREFVEATATRTNALESMRSARVIHFATHALIDDRHPLFSGVLLAAHNDESILLTAQDVANLHLDADVAVLSGCDTAEGRLSNGEGLIGLAWAFGVAGCPTTVATQWSTASKPASILMIEFHRRLLAGDSVPKALQYAQTKLRENPRYAHPFDWAPFVVFGVPQPSGDAGALALATRPAIRP